MKEPTTWDWDGRDRLRPLQLCRPCACGCDERNGPIGAGYLITADAEGKGVTIFIEDEAVFRRLEQALYDQGITDSPYAYQPGA